MIADTPMHRVLFVELTPQQQDAFLDGIRARRLVSVNKHAELAKLKQQAKDNQTRRMLDVQSRQMEKEIANVTRWLEKIELRYNKIAALRAMIESEAEQEEASNG